MTCSRWMRAAIAGAMLFGFAGSAIAADPTPAAIATARKLIDLKGASNMYDPVFVGIILKTKDTLLQTNPMVAKDLDAVALQVRNEFRPRLDQLKDEVAKLYAAQFTEAELNEAYKFYSTPLGMKLIKAEPEVLQESMGYASKWADTLAEEVMAKMRDEMHKRGHDM